MQIELINHVNTFEADANTQSHTSGSLSILLHEANKIVQKSNPSNHLSFQSNY